MKLVTVIIFSLSALGLAHASSSIGTSRELSEGATAIAVGDYRRGVELTRAGLGTLPAARDRAAALSNLCAGLVGLQEFVEALRSCDEALAINPHNWRTWNNRAAALLGLGLTSRALLDIQQGLELNPDSQTLQQTLQIALARQAEEQRQRRRPQDQIAQAHRCDARCGRLAPV
jgi:tetratricopeptide (TPR) repeat protein